MEYFHYIYTFIFFHFHYIYVNLFHFHYIYINVFPDNLFLILILIMERLQYFIGAFNLIIYYNFELCYFYKLIYFTNYNYFYLNYYNEYHLLKWKKNEPILGKFIFIYYNFINFIT